MNAEKLPSGKYRARATYYDKDGKRRSKSFTSTSRARAEAAAEDFMEEARRRNLPENRTLGELMTDYIESRKNILSPSSITGYRKIQRNYFLELQNRRISDITKSELQNAVNLEVSKGLSPKTISCAYGLVSAVLRNEDISFNIKLPPRQKKAKIRLDFNVIREIGAAVKGNLCELPVLLALTCSLRMSEILGLKWSDYDGETITVQRVILYSDEGTVVRNRTKSSAGNRIIIVPDSIKQLLNNTERVSDFIVPYTRNQIYKHYIACLETAGLPKTTFHFLRHINASVMKSLNIPDTYAMERGGWETDYIYKNTYIQTLSDETVKTQRVINEKFDDLLS